MFEPETNQGYENTETKQFNSPLKVLDSNIQFKNGISVLVAGTIQSPNYERGVRGWCLYADGKIDFPGI